MVFVSLCLLVLACVLTTKALEYDDESMDYYTRNLNDEDWFVFSDPCCCDDKETEHVCDIKNQITYVNPCQADCNYVQKWSQRKCGAVSVEARATTVLTATLLAIHVSISVEVSGVEVAKAIADQKITKKETALGISSSSKVASDGAHAVAEAFTNIFFKAANEAITKAETVAVVTTTDDDDDDDDDEEWQFNLPYDHCCCDAEGTHEVCDIERHITYQNSCQAECAGVFKFKRGRCLARLQIVSVKALAEVEVKVDSVEAKVTITAVIQIAGQTPKTIVRTATGTLPIARLSTPSVVTSQGDTATANALVIAARAILLDL